MSTSRTPQSNNNAATSSTSDGAPPAPSHPPIATTHAEELDKLCTDGTIKNIHTCCNSDLYCDHHLSITLANGTRINSSSSGVIKSIEIFVEGMAYLKKKTDANPYLAMISVFTNADMRPTVVKFSYQKAVVPLLDASHSPANPAVLNGIKIEAAEFDAVFEALPKAVQNILERRLQPKPMVVQSISNNGRNVPIVFI